MVHLASLSDPIPSGLESVRVQRRFLEMLYNCNFKGCAEDFEAPFLTYKEKKIYLITNYYWI